MTPMDLYSKVLALAKERGLPISQLEDRLGFPKGTIKNWKNFFPSIERIAAIATYFEVTIDSIWGLAPTKPHKYAKIIATCEKQPLSEEGEKAVVSVIKAMQAQHNS